MGQPYTKEDIAEDTGVSTSEAAAAGHQARDDMESDGLLPERSEQKVSDSPEGREIYQHLEQLKQSVPDE